MSQRSRIGIRVVDRDWLWQQIYAGIVQRGEEQEVELVQLDQQLSDLSVLPGEELTEWLAAQPTIDLDAIICPTVTDSAWYDIMERGLPVIALTETTMSHPLLTAPRGLSEMAEAVGAEVATRLQGRGNVLIVGGLTDTGEAGRTRLQGLQQAFQHYPELNWQHVPSLWSYGQAYAQVFPALLQSSTPVDAIIGLNDAQALAARDAVAALGLLSPHTVVAALETSPMALTALKDGSMALSADFFPPILGRTALDAAVQIARHQSPPQSFRYQWRLITPQIAQTLPPPVSPELAQERLLNLHDVAQVIDYLSSTVLDRPWLLDGISRLIQANYGFDHVQIFRLLADEQALLVEASPLSGREEVRIPLSEPNVLRTAIQENVPVFIADVQQCERFPPDPRWPAMRARIIFPIFQGGTLFGLLDMHTYQVRRHKLPDFQIYEYLAERVGICMRSADLYHETVQARATALEAQKRAEQADRLKTRLLANVSHEFRTPLNAILNSAQAMLATSSAIGDAQGKALLHDLQLVEQNTRHLSRLVNDLLDLSRAEIDELTIAPEVINTRAFLDDVFSSMARTEAARTSVRWEAILPESLPLIEADPVRLRQILLNLLDNARKFTRRGQIVLGAEVLAPNLHLWVQDSGCGISSDQQERIFEPFVTSEHPQRRPRGVGLGLSITRHLIALHHGSLTLDSQPGHGSTFHVYLPLPSLGEQVVSEPADLQPILLLISAQDHLAPALLELCRRQQLEPRRLTPDDDLDELWKTLRPRMIAWDVAHAVPGDWALIERLRRHPSLSQIPFMVFGQEEGIAPELTVGMTNVVTKPIDRQTLLRLIETMGQPQVKGSVLIVDDDPRTCNLYSRLAAQAFPGYTIHTAENGTVAFKLLGEIVPSLVLLDLVMPDIDGFVVLDYLRAMPRTSKVPVLILSGRTLTPEDVQRLNHAHVVFQNKDLLTPDEMARLFQHTATSPGLIPQTSILIKYFMAHVQSTYASDLNLQTMAAAVGVSERHLDRIVRRELGISPREYLNRYRIKRARELLHDTKKSVRSVALLVGFEDPNYFSKVFRLYTGCSPRRYQRR